MAANSAFALWRGGAPERWMSAAYVAAWLVSRAVYNYRDWLDPQWAVLGVDLVLLAASVVLALAYNRIWLLFATAFQLLAVVIHVAIMADASVRALPYVRGLVIWSYLTQLTLFVGVLQHLQARRLQPTEAMAPARR